MRTDAENADHSRTTPRDLPAQLRAAAMMAIGQRVDACARLPEHADALIKAGASWFDLLNEAADAIDAAARPMPEDAARKAFDRAAEIARYYVERESEWGGEPYYKPAAIATAREIEQKILLEKSTVPYRALSPAVRRQCSVCNAIVAEYPEVMCCHCTEQKWPVVTEVQHDH